jgi:hypothetical protein
MRSRSSRIELNVIILTQFLIKLNAGGWNQTHGILMLT